MVLYRCTLNPKPCKQKASMWWIFAVQWVRMQGACSELPPSVRLWAGAKAQKAHLKVVGGAVPC